MSSRTPIKSQPSVPQPAQISIPTSPKPAQRRSRRLAMSVKEIKEVAKGLRGNNKSPEIGRSDEDLMPAVAPKPSRGKTRVELPEKYESLLEFFNSMESSIRLFSLKRASPTFQNISASIENLTDRRFTYEHLAQLKYILPEAIDIEKVILRDEVTCCMKPDLRITLQVSAIEHKEESRNSDLRRIFRERLVNFLKEHPEVEDIPRDQLPHPFGQTESTASLNDLSPSNKPSCSAALEQFAIPSHMSCSFRRSFSKKLPIPDSQRTPLACSSDMLSKDVPLINAVSSPVKCITKPPVSKKSFLTYPSGTLSVHEEEANKSSHVDSKCEKNLVAIDGTPSKLVSTPARLQSATPEIQTPKRSRSAMDISSPSIVFNSPLPKSSSRRSARTQLFKTPTKIAKEEDQDSNSEDDADNKPSCSAALEQFAIPSNMSCSFHRSFSKKLLIPESQRTPLACSSDMLSKDDPHINVASSPVKCITKPPVSKKSFLTYPVLSQPSGTLSVHEQEANKSSHADNKCEKNLVAINGTPSKLVSTPARLQSATPESQTPKRSRSAMDISSPSMGFSSSPPKTSSKRSARTQLFNSPTKIANKEDQDNKVEASSEDDVISFLPKSLLQSVREKERKAIEDRDAGVAEATRRRKLLAGISNIYDMILLIVQSSKRSVMTKQELIYKLIANNLKIVDRGEVEEQLKLLQELVPDWILEKVASSGDILCCVNKVSSHEEIRQKILEAV